MTQITQNVSEKIKKYLNIQEDIDVFGLYDIVFECMTNSHPDQFEESLKKEAEERFKILNGFISDLKRDIDYLKLTKRPSEIVLYERNFEIVKSKNELLILENENKSLKGQVSTRDWTIGQLNSEIDLLKSERYKESTEEIKQLYKPSKSGIITVGVSSLLLILIGITTQFDAFNKKLADFSPIDPKIINWGLFIILILTFIVQLARVIKGNILSKLCDKLISQTIIKAFYESKIKTEVTTYSTIKYFTEIDVEDFICEIFFNRKSKYIFYVPKYRIFNVDDQKSLNNMKNIFIDNLLNKKYISYHYCPTKF